MSMDGGASFFRAFKGESVAQAAKFCLVGLLNTAITWLAFHCLVDYARFDDNLSNAIAYILGLINSFVWNKLWTFRSRGFRIAEILLFLAAFAIAWGAQFLVYRCFAGLGWRKDVAILPAMAIYTLVGFLANKLVTFRKGKWTMAYDLRGKTALVTGASSGIGSCIARQLAAKGARPVLVARGVPRLEALAAELKSAYGVDCPVIKADLSLPGEAAKLHDECLKRGLAVDVLVNNAGIGLFGSALDQEPAVVESMLRLNILSLVELCQLFGRDMAGRGEGRILNVASMVALMPTPYFSNYAASKAYVRSFTSSLRAELKGSGVRVGALLPGYVKTNFDAASQVTNRNYAEMSAKMGMKPEKVAAVGIRLIRSGRSSSVAGLTNKIGAFFINGIPKAFLARVSYGYLKSVIGKDE